MALLRSLLQDESPEVRGDAVHAALNKQTAERVRLLAEQTGMTIGTAWFVHAMSGRCRGPSGWIDFTAIALGACWIVLAVASIAFTLM